MNGKKAMEEPKRHLLVPLDAVSKTGPILRGKEE